MVSYVSLKNALYIINVITTEIKTAKKQFSGMMTHCVAVYGKDDLDSELKSWLKEAYHKA